MPGRPIRVSPRFDRYGEVSREVMAVFHSITPLVEPMSMDEAYLDVSNVVLHGIPPSEIARLLKIQVKGKTGLTISVGCSTSKTVSKIASDLEKPDGLVIVEPGREREFLAPLPVLKIPGIGPSSERRLIEKGIVTIGDLARQTEPWAREVFGKRGPVLLTMARGEDLFPVVTEHSVKSVSAEDTFGADTSDPDELAERISAPLPARCQPFAEVGSQGQDDNREAAFGRLYHLHQVTDLAIASARAR